MRLIDADKIEWYGCTSEDDCPYPDRECKDCSRGQCSKKQVESLPTIHAVSIEVLLQEIRQEILDKYRKTQVPACIGLVDAIYIIDNHLEQYKEDVECIEK